MRRTFRVAMLSVFSITVMLSGLPVSAAQDALPRQRVEALASAQQNLRVTGQFVHDDGRELHGYALQSQGGSAVSLVALDARIVPSSGSAGSGSVEGSSDSPFFPAQALLDAEQFYAMDACEPRRIAGRVGDCIRITPRDDHRLGYTLWVDENDGVLLGSMVLGQRGEVLERLQFLQLVVTPRVADHEPGSAHRVEHLRSATPPSAWLPNWVPPGFELQAVNESADGKTAHYSDGVAEFSVFMLAEPGGADRTAKPLLPESVSRHGATVVVERVLNRNGAVAARMALAGELPLPTARRILLGVQNGS